jgi:hypothetical protein
MSVNSEVSLEMNVKDKDTIIPNFGSFIVDVIGYVNHNIGPKPTIRYHTYSPSLPL